MLVTNTDNGSERTVFTNAAGFYTARSLLPGNYSVTATLEGMQTVLREGIVLLVGQRIDVSISMDLGVTADIITVTGETPLIEVSRSTPAQLHYRAGRSRTFPLWDATSSSLPC